MEHEWRQQKRLIRGAQCVRGLDYAVVAVDGERPPGRHEQLRLLAVCVIGACTARRHIEDPVGAPNVERDVPADLRDAERAAWLVNSAERHQSATAGG